MKICVHNQNLWAQMLCQNSIMDDSAHAVQTALGTRLLFDKLVKGSENMKSPTYTPEFRAEAVKLVLAQGLTIEEAAQRIAMPKGTLASWVSAASTVG
ncbi:transposase [Duganella sp. FT27W]|nr:transposase [Duganella sp. FT27W]